MESAITTLIILSAWVVFELVMSYREAANK